MITEAKLKVYRKYKGDLDFWARRDLKKDGLVMKDEDFFLIDSLLQDIELVKRGLVSEKFAENINRRLQESCDNEATIDSLKGIANTD